MAIPPIPSNFLVQTGNGENYISWDNAAGATSYTLQRSTDGVTYTNYATLSTNSYLDTAVTLGTEYWYQVSATGTSGTSPYTVPQSAVPTTQGEMTLGQIRLASKQRADRVNSQFVTTQEWNSYINQSLYELYDLLITCYGDDYYVAPSAKFYTSGATQNYPLPNGVLTFKDDNNNDFVAAPIYKLLGVDLGVNTAANGYVTVRRFNFIDRNRYFYPNTASTIYGVFNMQYILLGDKIQFIPIPSANQPIRLWYIPRMNQLLKDTDTTSEGVSGWLEYVIIDAAIKALQKEESDVSVLMAQKEAMKRRIEAAASNRDAGQGDTISDTRATSFGGQMWGPNGAFKGGW